MIIQNFPDNELKSYIDEIWYVDLDTQNLNDIVMPTGQVHLVFNLGDKYTIFIDNQEIEVPDFALFSQYNKAIKIKYKSHIQQLGIAFKPFAFLMFFGIEFSLNDKFIIDCKSIDNNELMTNLINEVLNIKNFEQKEFFKNIENLFMKNINKNIEINFLEDMINYIENNNGEITVKELAIKFNSSISKIERIFKKSFNITPKAYFNIIKFRKSMEFKDPLSFYYDQSHFIKFCKKYTMKTPENLINADELSLKYMLKK
ncbi:MAG: DUF6597 domain-containing transcriptional factor [Pleomorphochaeta sp.]